MLPYHVGLVSEESGLAMDELGEVAAALQKQVTRDFGPIWNIVADVSAFASLDKLPLDYWPIIIRDDIGDDDLGYHQADDGQPYSLVRYEDGWHITASHEALEMLCDPFGRRLIAGQSPAAGQGRVQFLVEICDPCEADDFAYSINGVYVSDFYTPHYFDPVTAPGVRYSFNKSLVQPRQVREGGYLTWKNPADGQVWQRTWFSGAAPIDQPRPDIQITDGNLRAAVDRVTASDGHKAMNRMRSLGAASEAAGAASASAFRNRAKALRAQIRESLS
jgi:hypothetical protein